MILFESTKLDRVKLIKPDYFEDFRGEYAQLYNDEDYKSSVPEIRDINFVEDDMSLTEHHCLKGIHGNNTTWKLISCLYGKFYLVVINYDKKSKDFGKWQAFILSDKNRHQVLVPPKYGNGHLCLSEKSIFYYKQSEYYNIDNQFTIPWNDKRFNIYWPIKNPIISRRDESGNKSYVEK